MNRRSKSVLTGAISGVGGGLAVFGQTGSALASGLSAVFGAAVAYVIHEKAASSDVPQQKNEGSLDNE